jgi:hypothetical protein
MQRERAAMEFGKTDTLFNPIIGSASQTVQHKGKEESAPKQKPKPRSVQASQASPSSAASPDRETQPVHHLDVLA